MAVKNGYGSISGELANTYVLGAPLAGVERNLIINLPQKNKKRIFGIDVSYTTMAGFEQGGLVGGRLLIVGAKYENDTEEIKPDRKELPDSLQTAIIHYDMFIGNEYTIDTSSGLVLQDGVQNIRAHLDFGQGIPVGGNQDCSIILTYAMTYYQVGTADKYATTQPHLATMNVRGFLDGSDSIFKNIT